MGLSAAAKIAFSAIHSQPETPAADADDHSQTEQNGYQLDTETQASDATPSEQTVAWTEDDYAYRASTAAFEDGADLWDLLNVVPRD
jgi:hypothetical protein